MGMLAGAIVPSLITAVEGEGIARAACEVGDMLDYAAAAAVARRCPVAVLFDPERCACRAQTCMTQLPWRGEDDAAGTVVLASRRLPDGIEVNVFYDVEGRPEAQRNGRGGTVVFRPDGSADDAEVELSDAHGRTQVLPVHPLGGKVVFVEEE